MLPVSRTVARSTGAVLALFLVAAALTVAALPGPAAARSAVRISGLVVSGPESTGRAMPGARVTVYETSAAGSSAIGSTTTDSTGHFSLSADGRPAYVVARSGHRTLVTLLASAQQREVVVNELTTVAAAYATAQLGSGAGIAATGLQLASARGMAANLVSPASGRPSRVIRSSPNRNETNAWRELGTLANLLTACVRSAVTERACTRLFDLTATANTRTTWNAIRSIARHPATHVAGIFDLGDALHAYRPYLRHDQGPRADRAKMRLDAFTLAVKFNATGRTVNGAEVCPFGGLGNIAFDQVGRAWITNNVVQGTPRSSNCIVVLRRDGKPSDGSAGSPNSPLLGGGILGQGFGIGFDPQGRVWSGNFGWGGTAYEPTIDGTTPGGGVSLFTGDGTAISGPYGYASKVFRVQGTVSDAQGNIWLASYGNNRVQVLPQGDPATAYPPYADENEEPFDIRLDTAGDAWVSYTKSNALSKLHFTPAGVQRLFTVPLGDRALPKGVAVDSQGNGWVAAGSQNAIHAFSSTGSPLGVFSGGGIIGPWGISTDSADTVWVANFGNVVARTTKFGVSRLCGADLSSCPPGSALGDPLTPPTGYTLPSGGSQVLLQSGAPLNGPGTTSPVFKPLMRETAVQPDVAGNLWVTNNWKPGDLADYTNPGGDGLVIFIGVAAPVAPSLFNRPPVAP